MSLWRKKIGGLMLASIATAAVAGCGGNTGGIPSQPLNNTVSVDGGVTTDEGISPTTLAASDEDQLVELTPAGGSGPIQAVLPPGVALNSGESAAIIPDNTLLLQGLEGGADRNPGDIYVNGHLSRRARLVRGRLKPAVLFPAGNYNVRVVGPYVVRQGANVLTVQEFNFHFRSDGHHLSLPKKLTGQIPANGSNNWTNSVTATFYPAFASGTANLHITHLNGTLNKTVPVQGNTATFTDIQNDTQSHIPSQGVQVVEFTHF